MELNLEGFSQIDESVKTAQESATGFAREPVSAKAENKALRSSLRHAENRVQRAALNERAVWKLAHALALFTTEITPRPGVYLLIGANRSVAYVGQSSNVVARLGGHRAKDFVSVRMLPVDDELHRLRLERDLIELLRPVLNIALNPAVIEATEIPPAEA